MKAVAFRHHGYAYPAQAGQGRTWQSGTLDLADTDFALLTSPC